MKIVHLIYALGNGGAENMLVDIANEQSKYAKVYVVVVNNLIDSHIRKRLCREVVLYAINRKPGSRSLGKLVVLNVILLRLRPNIIHCHNHSLANLIPSIPKSKKLLTVHSMNYPTQNLHKYHRLVAISDSVKDYIRSHRDFSIQRIYNGICFDQVAQRSPAIFQNPFRIVQVSRLDHNNKGQHILLDALSIIRTMHPAIPISADFIGGGASYSFLRSYATDKEISTFFHFLGDKPREWIYENLCSYDLFAQPSLHEGFGLTIAEAMAAKVPVLVSNTQGPLEVICNGDFGTSFEAGNALDCARQIFSIIDQYDVKVNQAKHAYNYCIENYSISATVEKYLHIYPSLGAR